MKKFFTFFAAALLSVSMFGMTVTEDIPLNAETWGWGYNCQLNFNNGVMECMTTAEWGAAATGWNEPNRDLSEWDKIVIEVAYTNGCDGEWFKLKAYLRDFVNKDSEQGQMETTISQYDDDSPKTMVINLKEEGKNVNLTACGVLAIQCQPNGGEFKISRVYLEKEVEAETEYFLVGSINGWNVVDLTDDLKFAANPNAEGEYMINYAFAANDDFKVVGRQAGAQEVTWFPEGMDNNYVITEAGNYTVYFRPDGQGGEGWHYGLIYAARNTEDIENVVLTEKAQKVVMDGVMYIVRDGKLFNATGAQVR